MKLRLNCFRGDTFNVLDHIVCEILSFGVDVCHLLEVACLAWLCSLNWNASFFTPTVSMHITLSSFVFDHICVLGPSIQRTFRHARSVLTNGQGERF